MRRSDRIEVLVLGFAVLLTVVAIPVAGAIGSARWTASGREHSGVVEWSDR